MATPRHRHPTFQFVLLKTAWRRRERSVRDRQLPPLSLSLFLSFCLPFEITLRCHDIRQVPRSPPLPPPPPPSFLPTKSSSVSFVSIFTEFREDAHISRREVEGVGRGRRRRRVPRGKREKRWNLHFFLTAALHLRRRKEDRRHSVTDSNGRLSAKRSTLFKIQIKG